MKKLIFTLKELSEDGRISGLLLLIATITSLLLVNLFNIRSYSDLWHIVIGPPFFAKSISYWINDGLMAVFFFLVGMEIRREITEGELSDRKQALLPVLAAAGGVIVPAIIFILFNFGKSTSNGWAIPTATDIAFSLGILSLLGKRVPNSLRVFLTALAIIDDLIAILIIALFYTGTLNICYFLLAAFVISVLFTINRKGVAPALFYVLLGLLLWLFILKSGIHATISGVLLAMLIPKNMIDNFERVLHKPVNYIILPIFALSNLAISISFDVNSLFSSLSIGIICGLLFGKPVGIALMSYVAVKTGIASKSGGITIRHFIGMGFTAGIGFTMSIFISMLSFPEPALQSISKLAVLIGSALSAAAGLLILLGAKETGAAE